MTKHVILTHSPSLADEKPKPCIVDLDEIVYAISWPNGETHMNLKNGLKVDVKESIEEVYKLIKKRKKK